MKSLKLAFILAVGVVFTQAWKVEISRVSEDETTSELFVFQNGVERVVSGVEETIEIERKEFSLRFFNRRYDAANDKFYSAQIAAFTDKLELEKIRVGMEKSGLPCFEPGSGMAPSKSGRYESLIFNNNGHHYTTYENAESKRLKLLDGTGDVLKLEFEVNSLFYNGKKVKMKAAKLKEFYIAFLIDGNLNGVIDDGELHKVTIKLK
jgi:hypothetical protein